MELELVVSLDDVNRIGQERLNVFSIKFVEFIFYCEKEFESVFRIIELIIYVNDIMVVVVENNIGVSEILMIVIESKDIENGLSSY